MTTISTALPPTISDRTAVRNVSDDVRAVPAALRSEWIKLSSLRADKVILALTAVVGAAVAGGLAATATHPSLTASEFFIYPLPLVAMLAAVAGILLFTSEAQHGTLAVILAARPARWVLVAAKTVTAAMGGAVLAATGMVAGFAGSALRCAGLGSRLGGVRCGIRDDEVGGLGVCVGHAKNWRALTRASSRASTSA